MRGVWCVPEGSCSWVRSCRCCFVGVGVVAFERSSQLSWCGPTGVEGLCRWRWALVSLLWSFNLSCSSAQASSCVRYYGRVSCSWNVRNWCTRVPNNQVVCAIKYQELWCNLCVSEWMWMARATCCLISDGVLSVLLANVCDSSNNCIKANVCASRVGSLSVRVSAEDVGEVCWGSCTLSALMDHGFGKFVYERSSDSWSMLFKSKSERCLRVVSSIDPQQQAAQPASCDDTSQPPYSRLLLLSSTHIDLHLSV
jgi:hypothetical protein